MNDQMTPHDDPPSRNLQNIVDENLFRFLLILEVQKAMRLQYCFSVVCIAPALRPGDVDGSLMKDLAEVAVGQVRATDVVSTLSQSVMGLLLIDAETRTLPPIHRRIKEELEAHLLTVEGRRWRVTWSAGGGCYPQTASSGGDLLRQALDLMTRATREGADRLYLPS